MDRETVRHAALALLAVVALALTATTLPSARQSAAPSSAGSGPPGESEGGGLPIGAADPLPQLLDLPYLTELLTLLAALVVVAALLSLVRHWRSFARITVAMLVLTAIAVLLLQFVPLDPSPVEPSGVSTPSGNLSGAPGGGETATADSPSLLSIAVVVVIGLALLGTAVATGRRTPDEETDEEESDSADNGRAAAVGRAAGRAADRIEATTDLDNEVYRAWSEMTGLLEVSRPETTTARQFEQAAVEAGMERTDVASLTDLFERARYDDYEVAPDDEAQAVELLRRIESRYAEGES